MIAKMRKLKLILTGEKERHFYYPVCFQLLVVMTMMMQDYADYDVGVFMPRMMCWGEGHDDAGG